MIVVAIERLSDNAMQLAGMQGFEGVKLSAAFAEPDCPFIRAAFALLYRCARKPIMNALIMVQQDRDQLQVDVKAVLLDQPFDLARGGNRD